jgi:hypothetical protein
MALISKMTNSNESVVRTLLDGASGRISVKLIGGCGTHTYIDAQIGDMYFVFYVRNNITRVARATLPNGEEVEYECADIIDPWAPPKTEFPEWWASMGETARSEPELRAEFDEANKWFKMARQTAEEATITLQRWSPAYARLDLYNPWQYLTSGQQERLESMLRESLSR